jgi:hypothetical protein
LMNRFKMHACRGVFTAFNDTLTRVSNLELEEHVEESASCMVLWYNTQKCFKCNTPRTETMQTTTERRCQSHSTGRAPTWGSSPHIL